MRPERSNNNSWVSYTGQTEPPGRAEMWATPGAFLEEAAGAAARWRTRWKAEDAHRQESVNGRRGGTSLSNSCRIMLT